jgi:hypothetical protein
VSGGEAEQQGGKVTGVGEGPVEQGDGEREHGGGDLPTRRVRQPAGDHQGAEDGHRTVAGADVRCAGHALAQLVKCEPRYQAGEHEQAGDDVAVQEHRDHRDASPGHFGDAQDDAQAQHGRQAGAPLHQYRAG